MINGRYADIIVTISHEKVDRPFQYRIPETLLGKITIGMCVIVPFGAGNKELAGYVIGIGDRPAYAEDKIKEIRRISEEGMSARGSQIRLAAWIREQYGSTMIAALRTVLPVGRKMATPQKRQIRLAQSPEETQPALAICRRKRQNARLRLLERLCEEGEIPYECATGELSVTPAVIRAVEGMRPHGRAALRSVTNKRR